MLRPFYGLKGAWNKQHMNVGFEGFDNSAGSPVDVFMENKIKSWGLESVAEWMRPGTLRDAFSLIGDMAFTGLWEHFKMTRFDFSEANGVITGSNLDLKENQHVVKPVIEWTLGFRVGNRHFLRHLPHLSPSLQLGRSRCGLDE